MARAPKKPAALKIAGNTLEEFLPLLPAEEAFRQCAAAGEVFEPEDYEGRQPEKTTMKNTIRAEFLRYMILGGCERSPVHPSGIGIEGCLIDCSKETGLFLVSTTIPNVLRFTNCNFCDGPINLNHALSNGIFFERCKIYSFHADGLNVGGALHFSNGTQITGRASLVGSKIGVELSCRRGVFHLGLDAQNVTINGNLLLDEKFITYKPVSFRNARIGGNLVCKGGKFLDPNTAISANRAKIDGNVDLENMEALGTIALTGSEIGGDFQPQNAQLSGSPALQLRNTKIGGTLHWRGIGYVNGEVDLSGATCNTLNTGNTSWMRKDEAYSKRKPKAEQETQEGDQPKKADQRFVKLDNFRYQGFTNLPEIVDSDYWIEWLKQQPSEHLRKKFKPRPWEQLAGVLDSMGYEVEARDIRIEKQNLHTRFMKTHEPFHLNYTSIIHWMQIFFRQFLWGPLVSYGYRPGNALIWLFAFIMIGTFIYSHAAKNGIMTPTHPLIYKEVKAGGFIPHVCAENWVYFPIETCAPAMPSEYSEFNSFTYALDVALPVVNFRMEDDWAPRVVHTDGSPNSTGWYIRLFEWILIGLGWILSLLFVSAVGSSLRR